MSTLTATFCSSKSALYLALSTIGTLITLLRSGSAVLEPIHKSYLSVPVTVPNPEEHQYTALCRSSSLLMRQQQMSYSLIMRHLCALSTSRWHTQVEACKCLCHKHCSKPKQQLSLPSLECLLCLCHHKYVVQYMQDNGGNPLSLI